MTTSASFCSIVACAVFWLLVWSCSFLVRASRYPCGSPNREPKYRWGRSSTAFFTNPRTLDWVSGHRPAQGRPWCFVLSSRLDYFANIEACHGDYLANNLNISSFTIDNYTHDVKHCTIESTAKRYLPRRKGVYMGVCAAHTPPYIHRFFARS